jgi:PAS domain S-box-containing protein
MAAADDEQPGMENASQNTSRRRVEFVVIAKGARQSDNRCADIRSRQTRHDGGVRSCDKGNSATANWHANCQRRKRNLMLGGRFYQPARSFVLKRTVEVLSALFVAAGTLLLWHQSHVHSELVQSIALENARAYSQALAAVRSVYTSEVVDRVRGHGFDVVHDYAKLDKAIPLPITLTLKIGDRIAEGPSGARVSLYSPYPFPSSGRAPGTLPDDFAAAAWEALKTGSQMEFARLVAVNGRRSLRFATADVMRARCVNCHNTHPHSPKTDWKEGDVRGVLEVTFPLEFAEVRARAGLWQSLALFAGFGALGVGALTLVIGTMRRSAADLEQRVQERTAALDQERYLLHTLMDTVPDAIYFKDQASRFLRISKALATRFGLKDSSEAIGRTDADFFSQEHAEEALADERELLRTGNPVIGKEEKETWPDGRETWVATTKLPLRDQNGRIVGTFGISREITDQVHAREALRAAKEAAESANRAKSAFLASMSHEIRTPLNGVIGLTELLLDTPVNKSQREYLQMMRESGETLLSVINDILDFSKIEAGKLDLERAEFDVRELVGDTAKSLGFRAYKKGLELACDIASDVPQIVVGDACRLRQILINLVGNAIKFTQNGEVVLRVDRQSQANNCVLLHFAVSDTGIGIPKDKLSAVFDAFVQADSSLARRHGGTGLGLAIASRLVELMGGRVWAESEVGRGSTFHFTTRFVLPESDGAAPAPPAISSLIGLRVLIVDDNPTNSRILLDMLTSWGMRPTALQDSNTALQHLHDATVSGSPYALVLTDCHMPDMDGFTLAARIKHEQILGSTVVMMLTSGGGPDDVVRCEELGISAYLRKPIKQSELFDAIALAMRVDLSSCTATESLISEPAPQTRPLRILLAEDSLVNQKLVVSLLEKWGHSTVVANTGKEAIAAVEAQSFDLILMDVQMPEMDGFEATAAIRDWEKAAGTHIPIVAMTAHAMKGDRERCLAAGMDDYVAKPIRFDVLRDVLDRRSPPENVVPIEPDLAPELVDWKAALKRVGGNRELLRQLADVLVRELPKLLEQIRDSVANQNASALKIAAHTFKGSIEYFPNKAAYDIVWRLEKMGRDGNLVGAAELLADLESETVELIQAIQTFGSTQDG